MISRRELDELATLPQDANSPILTIYLNVDQSEQANRNRGFQTALKSMLQSLAPEVEDRQRERFERDSQWVRELVEQYHPSATGLAIFSDSGRDLKRYWELQIPTDNLARWRPAPYLRPLLEARDEYQRYGVILTDRARSRLFMFFQGELVENKAAFAESDVHRFDGSGSDQPMSQMAFQRRSDEHARQHLRNVARTMGQLWEEQRFDRLVLAGTPEAVAELQGILAAALQKSIVGTTSLPIDASVDQIRLETERLHREAERNGEASLVDSLLTAAAKDQQAVTGLTESLAAVWQNRVRCLIYSEGYRPSGSYCPSCRRYLEATPACPECGATVESVGDLLEGMLEHVVSSGGDIEQVKGRAAIKLDQDGGSVGALLRF